MLRKSVVVILSLLFVLGCTLSVGAETIPDPYADDPVLSMFTADELEEMKAIAVSMLSEDEDPSEYQLVSNGDPANPDVFLQKVEKVMPAEVLAMIDNNEITAADMMDGYTAEVYSATNVMPYIEDEEGHLYSIMDYMTQGLTTLWDCTMTAHGVTIYARVRYTQYNNTVNTALECFRPTSYEVYYTNTGSYLPSYVSSIYSLSESTWVNFPGYPDGTDTSKFDRDYMQVSNRTNAPVEGTVYSYSTGFPSGYALSSFTAGVYLAAYSGSTLLVDDYTSFNVI